MALAEYTLACGLGVVAKYFRGGLSCIARAYGSLCVRPVVFALLFSLRRAILLSVRQIFWDRVPRIASRQASSSSSLSFTQQVGLACNLREFVCKKMYISPSVMLGVLPCGLRAVDQPTIFIKCSSLEPIQLPLHASAALRPLASADPDYNHNNF